MAVNTSLLNAPVADLTLDAAMSGTTYICTPTVGALRTITLPPVTIPGLRFRFLHAAIVAQVITFSSAAANIVGYWAQLSGAKTVSNGVQTVSFTATARPGDIIELTSDGANWYCQADTGVAAGLAFA